MSLTKAGMWGALLGVCLLASCAATPEQQTARSGAQALLNAEISARQGAAVSRVCLNNTEAWKALGDDVLLLEAGDEWYMAKLAGACNPESASAILASRGRPSSSCLRRGDTIFTGRPRAGERCVIMALHEWDENAEVKPSASATPAEP